MSRLQGFTGSSLNRGGSLLPNLGYKSARGHHPNIPQLQHVDPSDLTARESLLTREAYNRRGSRPPTYPNIGKSIAGFSGMEQKGRTTTLLISSEFEKSMVLSSRGSPVTSFIDIGNMI